MNKKILLIMFVVSLFLLNGCTQTKTVTRTEYVCSDGSIVDLPSLCPSITPETISDKTPEYFRIELDAMGARGNENNGFGDGWIDSEDCLESEYAKDKSFDSCKVQDVQILTGSDPNPLKINTGGLIFNNGVVFTAKCACYK